MIHLKISVIINTNWYIVVVNLKGRDGFEDVRGQREMLPSVILLNYCWYLHGVPCPLKLNLLKYLQLWWRQINSHTEAAGRERVTLGELVGLNSQLSSVETKMMMMVARVWPAGLAVAWMGGVWSISNWRLLIQTKQTELKQSQISETNHFKTITGYFVSNLQT